MSEVPREPAIPENDGPVYVDGYVGAGSRYYLATLADARMYRDERIATLGRIHTIHLAATGEHLA
jgi:hypothetical protein